MKHVPLKGHPRVPGCTLRNTLFGHTGMVYRVAWSPTGDTLALGSGNGVVQLWDPQKGELRHTLSEHTAAIWGVAWSPDGSILASGSADCTIRLWDVQTGKHHYTFSGHTAAVYSITWSPDGNTLASGSEDYTIKLWDVQTGMLRYTLLGHMNIINSVAWSPDGSILASGSDDCTVRLWDPWSGQLRNILEGHTDWVNSVAWSSDGNTLASGSTDNTVRLWDPWSGQLRNILEGHTDSVASLSFATDGHLLASSSAASSTRAISTICLWRTATWKPVATLSYPTENGQPIRQITFHPSMPILLTTGTQKTDAYIWDLDLTRLLQTIPTSNMFRYTNAKVVVVGDSGVGKSGLSLVLAGKPFAPTESTHGRRIWTIAQKDVKRRSTWKEGREILLWDLAGQPGYRFIHQLHLNEVTVALVVFDARSETSPLASVQYWDRALRQARSIQSETRPPLKKFLVAARCDRGGVGTSLERIKSLVQGLGFEGYFETSAKEEWQITELKVAIQRSIEWERLTPISSTHIFQQIKGFLVAEKNAGHLLSTEDVLYRLFLASNPRLKKMENLRSQFETCIRLVESAGLIQRLSFGNLVLLQPELLDAYASALINAVRDQPDGLGSITEMCVRMGDFPMPESERLSDRDQEKLLLIAMIEDMLRYELVIREEPFLVFPSQSTRENPDLPNLENASVIFTFEGAIHNIYATLAVRLSHSSLFTKRELWKNAITYQARVGGACGISLKEVEEGQGELTLFFDSHASEETRFTFEEYVQVHLHRKALPESIKRLLLFRCRTCGFRTSDQLVHMRLERGFNWYNCPACDTRVDLFDSKERFKTSLPSQVPEIDRAANQQRDRETAQLTVQGKKETGSFDVFLCYHGIDKHAVKRVGEQLKEHGLLPWLDEWELRPGLPWLPRLEEQIEHIKSAAVFVGKEGIGPWQRQELDALLHEFVDRECPVIPVLLEDVPDEPYLPLFLRGIIWVDFRKIDPDPLEQLIWGITGKRSVHR